MGPADQGVEVFLSLATVFRYPRVMHTVVRGEYRGIVVVSDFLLLLAFLISLVCDFSGTQA